MQSHSGTAWELCSVLVTSERVNRADCSVRAGCSDDADCAGYIDPAADADLVRIEIKGIRVFCLQSHDLYLTIHV